MSAFATNCDSPEDTLADMVVLAVVMGSLSNIGLCLFKSGMIDKGFVSCFGDCPCGLIFLGKEEYKAMSYVAVYDRTIYYNPANKYSIIYQHRDAIPVN